MADPIFHIGDVFDTSNDDDWWGPTRRVVKVHTYEAGIPVYDFVILDGERAGRHSSCSERQIIEEMGLGTWKRIEQHPSHIRLPRGV